MQVNKPKSAAKLMLPRSEFLNKTVLDTLKNISTMVGSTLGPGGRQVLIERPEIGLRPIVTKDGVTVIKHLGFENAAPQLILESVRDAAVRTASEAGDGPQPLWSKILTPTGHITMREAKVGMKICGTNNTIQEIEGVFPKGRKEVYEVEFSDGRIVECCSDHLWEVRINNGTKIITTTLEMSKDYKKTSKGNISYKYYIPSTQAFFEKRNLKLHPYLVGVLLGDGSFRDSGSIEFSIGKPKYHILNKLTLPDGLLLKAAFIESKNYYRVKIQGTTSDGKTIRNLVEEIGLRDVDSGSKYIPDDYLFSSLEDRKALLQGLIDTDGHINKRGRFEFSTISDKLMADFKFLCHSLSISINHRVYDKKNSGSYSETPIHRIVELKGYKKGNKVIGIRATGKFAEMRCIKVSNPDNLYLTDNFIVTHNTTTSTILSYAIAAEMQASLDKNKDTSPQEIIRSINGLWPTIEDFIKSKAIIAETRDVLLTVAKMSANGDEEIATAVLDALDVVGDDGNMTIIENVGPVGYKIERMQGYTFEQGYENSCRNMATAFFNDKTGTKIVLDSPIVLMYNGVINDLGQVFYAFDKINDVIHTKGISLQHVVLVAHGFSDSAIGDLQLNWNHAQTKVKIVPLLTPDSFIKNSKIGYLQDLQAYVGLPIFNPVDRPVTEIDAESIFENSRTSSLEIERYKATFFAKEDEDAINCRVAELKEILKAPESEYEVHELRIRIGKLTAGIAKLEISAPSSGETREKRDRAEDAWMAVKGAINHGACAGGGKVLMSLSKHLAALSGGTGASKCAGEIISNALKYPVRALYENYGASNIESLIMKLESDSNETFDLMKHCWVPEVALLDSVPAVLESIRNSISIASLLGSLGGIVAFKRDLDADKDEERFVRRFERSGGLNE